MPPTSRGRAAHGRQASDRKKPKRKTTAPRAQSKAMTKSSNSSFLSISTFVPKQSFLRLRYNQTFNLSAGGDEYYRFTVAMNNPNAVNLVQLISSSTNVYQTNNDLNFTALIAPLFQQYDHAVVVRSAVTCLARPGSANFKTEQYPVTLNDATNPEIVKYTQWQDPIEHGELVTWSANVDSQFGIAPDPDIQSIRNDIPGIQQKKLLAFKGHRKGCKLTNKYNPKRAFAIKDIGDNQGRIGLQVGTAPSEQYWTHIGIRPLFNSTAIPTGPSMMPNLIVTFQVDYVLKFTERKSLNNAVRPTAHDHSREL